MSSFNLIHVYKRLSFFGNLVNAFIVYTFMAINKNLDNRKKNEISEIKIQKS